MNNTQHKMAVKEATKAKFRGRESIKSKTTPLYPANAEREFRRITTGYMKILNHSLKRHLPVIMQAYKAERQESRTRHDDIRDLETIVRRELLKAAAEMEKELSAYDLEAMVEKIAKMTRNTSLREWKRAVRNTLGIDLLDDYYSGEFYEAVLRQWASDSVNRIKSIPNDTLGEMQHIIFEGFRSGMTIRDLSREIQETYNVTKRKAQFLARDQVATLNAQITKRQQEDAGCKRYRWSASGDSRVRECHKSLDGKIISWDDPPEMWYTTKKGVVRTGRRCHPGEDYACRCVAIPVFDIATLDIPMKDKIVRRTDTNGDEGKNQGLR